MSQKSLSRLTDRCKETPLRSGHVNTRTKKNFENLYFSVTNVFSVSKHFCGTLICPLLIWQFGLKSNVSVEQGKSLLTPFRDQQI